jgi:hypothetical protein
MNISTKNYLDRLNLIYYGLIALPLVLFPVVYLPMKEGVSTSFDQGGILYYLAGLLLFLVIFFARRLFQRSLKVIETDWMLEQKLQAYSKASVIFYILGMVSCMISVGLLMFTKHQLFVATYPILLLILSFFRPTLERLKRDLPLTKEDLAVIGDQQ